MKFSKEDREPEFNDLFEFLNDRALTIKSSFGQELIRLQSSENSKQQKQMTDVKKAKPEKPAKTLMTASAPAASASVTPSNSSEQTTPKPKVCKMCDKTHFITECKAFKDLTVEKRNEFCKEKGMCYNCLNGGHRLYQCRVRSRCDECKGKHHTMLHSAE